MARRNGRYAEGRGALLVFTPGRPVAAVGKRHLHPDEVPTFEPAEPGATVLNLAAQVGVAICYEISVLTHAEALAEAGAAVILASVAKTPAGVAEACVTLGGTARRFGVPALLVNCAGTCEGQPAGGGSFALDRAGRVTGRLGASQEGVLLVDAVTTAATALPVAL